MLRIGLFSKLGKTTIKTLRHYDEVGLLKPAHIDFETGYRYYTIDQLQALHDIVALRQLGFSLERVGEMLGGRGIPELLLQQQAALEAQQKTIADQLLRLNHYIQIREGQTKMDYNAVVKQIPSYTVYSYRTSLASFDDIYDLIPELQDKLARTNPGLCCVEPSYCVNIYLDGEHRESDINIEFCEAVTTTGNAAEGIEFKTLPAIKAVCVLHRGPYEQLGAAYAYALKWIEANGYRMAGDPRESFLEGNWSTPDESQWLTEVQVPVESK